MTKQSRARIVADAMAHARVCAAADADWYTEVWPQLERACAGLRVELTGEEKLLLWEEYDAAVPQEHAA